jgi:hypothetical protein
VLAWRLAFLNKYQNKERDLFGTKKLPLPPRAKKVDSPFVPINGVSMTGHTTTAQNASTIPSL